jgi:hypothetical protein
VENIFQKRIAWQLQPAQSAVRLQWENSAAKQAPLVQDLRCDTLLIVFRLKTLCKDVPFEQFLLE